jgi:hypothetical protein
MDNRNDFDDESDVSNHNVVLLWDMLKVSENLFSYL